MSATHLDQLILSMRLMCHERGIDLRPDTPWGNQAGNILSIASTMQNTIDRLDIENRLLKEEIKKLKGEK